MPRKIRELIRDLERAGFVNRGGKGSHRNFRHALTADVVVISGQLGVMPGLTRNGKGREALNNLSKRNPNIPNEEGSPQEALS